MAAARNPSSLRTDDIERARPQVLPPFVRGYDGWAVPVEGGGPRPLHAPRPRGHGHDGLDVSDIDRAAPRVAALETKRRPVDPLAPAYALPTAPPVEPPPVLPFKRHLYDVSDIDGARPRKPYVRRDGQLPPEEPPRRSRSLGRARVDRAANHEDDADIVLDGVFRSRRTVDALNPRYIVHGMEIADDGVGTTPTARHARARDGPFYSLTTGDIDGATAGAAAVAVGGLPVELRRDFLVTNSLAGIEGARAGSLARGPPPRGGRATDPNERDYALPGGSCGSGSGSDVVTRAGVSDGSDDSLRAPVGRSRYAATAAAAARHAVASTGAASTTPSQPHLTRARSEGAVARLSARRVDPRDVEVARLRAALDAVAALTGDEGRRRLSDALREGGRGHDDGGGGKLSEHRAAFAYDARAVDAVADTLGAGAPSTASEADVGRVLHGPPPSADAAAAMPVTSAGDAFPRRGRTKGLRTPNGELLAATVPHGDQALAAARRLRRAEGGDGSGGIFAVGDGAGHHITRGGSGGARAGSGGDATSKTSLTAKLAAAAATAAAVQPPKLQSPAATRGAAPTTTTRLSAATAPRRSTAQLERAAEVAAVRQLS